MTISAEVVRAIVAQMKLPRLELYSGDWLKDPVSSCSIAAQGLWFRMLLAMHDAKPYGHLADASGRPLPDAVIVKRVDVSGLREYRKLLQELRDVGTPGWSGDEAYMASSLRAAEFNGEPVDLAPLFLPGRDVIYSRRLLRDQRLRILRKLAGNPDLVTAFAHTNSVDLPTQTPTQTSGTRVSAGADSDNGMEEILFSPTREFDSFWTDLLRVRVPKPVHKDASRRAFIARVHSPGVVQRLTAALANYRTSARVLAGFVVDADRWLRDWESWEAYTEPVPTGPRLVQQEFGVAADDIRDLESWLRCDEWTRTDCSREEAATYVAHIREHFGDRLNEAPTVEAWLQKRGAA